MFVKDAIILLEEAKRNRKFTDSQEIFARNILRMRRDRIVSKKQEEWVIGIYEKSVGNFHKVYPQRIPK